MRLQNKVAIITGAAAGIGEAIACRFAEEGCALVLNDIAPEGLETVAAQCRSLGVPVQTVVADISDEQTGIILASRAIESFGRLDILINNAADFTSRSVENATVAEWQKVLNVNVIGTAMVSKAAIARMKANGGAIVNIASISSFIAQPNFATYNSSKGAVALMTRCMALDLAPCKIRVNAVCPGYIFTRASEREIARLGTTVEAWLSSAESRHMLGRVGKPREVANAVLFMASDEASFITGEHLMVDGGYVHW